MLALLLLTLPDALLNRSYSPEPAWQPVSVRCAMPIPATRVVAGELPPGLSVSPRGEIAGIPTTPGVFAFTIELIDGCSRRLEQRQIRVMPSPILLAEADVTDFHCPQGSSPFAAGIVRVSGSAPGRAYNVDVLSDEPKWLDAAPASGALPTEGMALESDTVRLSINPSKLAPGAHTARLRFSTWQGANAPELLVRLRVDSPESILARVAPPPSPLAVAFRIIEVPSPQIIAPPPPTHIAPPYFPKYIPKPKTQPGAARNTHHGFGRSRVLPFPKVTITPKPDAKNPEAKKPEAKKPDDKKVPESKVTKAPAKKEAPPERTKPSAMPPLPAATAKNTKPAPAH